MLMLVIREIRSFRIQIELSCFPIDFEHEMSQKWHCATDHCVNHGRTFSMTYSIQRKIYKSNVRQFSQSTMYKADSWATARLVTPTHGFGLLAYCHVVHIYWGQALPQPLVVAEPCPSLHTPPIGVCADARLVLPHRVQTLRQRYDTSPTAHLPSNNDNFIQSTLHRTCCTDRSIQMQIKPWQAYFQHHITPAILTGRYRYRSHPDKHISVISRNLPYCCGFSVQFYPTDLFLPVLCVHMHDTRIFYLGEQPWIHMARLLE